MKSIDNGQRSSARYSKVRLAMDAGVWILPVLTCNVSVQFGSLPLVIINDAKSAHELLVKQHSAVISRPVLYTFQYVE